ncbi:MAG TPA: CheR family methyltransferase, partial [Gemmataceae bacterium]|nr:CheR family methyltransferase [Gemmataceae bacterium]
PPHAPPDPLVVGVGASAGGLEDVQAFFAGIPPDAGVSFVLVFNLPPAAVDAFESLTKATSLPVLEVTDGQALRANTLHVVPPRHVATFDGPVFRLNAADTPGDRRTPVDRFFQSLAKEHAARGVAVVLAGAGSDGALGAKAVSDAGGLAMVQEPSTAGAGTMPQSAVATGAADHVLPPHDLAAELLAYARHHRQAVTGDQEAALRDEVGAVLPAVCDVLLQETGHNFRHYKTTTLVRRTLRRVQVLRVGSAREYLERLKIDRAEADQLFKDLLINVTAFFRDPEAFAALARDVLPALFERRSATDPVRVWVPGCATGEEAYTLAILIREHLDPIGQSVPVQIFATDLDDEALKVARLGAYPVGIADEVGPERLRRFFVKKGQQYHVAKELRELCLFSLHNLINDPPFGKLDLISCRNLLIYLGPHLQKKLVPLFHYALRPGGYLFLGPTETLAAHRELFRPTDSKHRISQRLPTVLPAPGLPADAEAAPKPVRPPNVPAAADTDTYLLMQRIVLDEFAPKAAVVNEEGQIVSASGNLEKYLTVTAGAFHNNVIRLARDGLKIGLRAALNEAARVRRKVTHDGLSLRTEGGGLQPVMVTVQPMPQFGEESGLFLVVFQDAGLPLNRDEAANARPAHPAADAAALIDQLEKELTTTRADLEKTVQDLEAANEELKSSNEELLSMNEELQSANEELQTSKEDVQAANAALADANTDLENLLASTGLTTLFLDDAGNLRRVVPGALAAYNVTPADVGRPLTHFTHRMKAMPPLPPALAVHAAGKPIDAEVEGPDGAWYLRRVLPYRTQDGTFDGIVVTFTDITDRKHAEERVRASEGGLRRVVENMPVMLNAMGEDGSFLVWNKQCEAVTGYAAAEVVGNPKAMELLYPDPGYRAGMVAEWAARTDDYVGWEWTLRAKDGTLRTIAWSNISARVPIPGWKTWGVGVDVTDARRAEAALKLADKHKDAFLAMLAHELRNPLGPVRNAVQVLKQLGPGDPTLLEARAMIDRQVSHMARLVDDLLDATRIAQGKILLRFGPCDLATIARQTAEDFRSVLEGSGVRLTVEVPPAPVWVDGDATRLAQIVGNLLHNAHKFTNPGGSVTVRLAEDPDRRAVLSVRDTGIGIDPAVLPHVFEVFSQADESLDRERGGLGLGLALVKGLAELHHGAVEASSAGPGRGSEFVVRLPLTEAPAAAAAAPAPLVVDGRGYKVLVIEDNADAADSLRMLLELVGHEVRTAATGPAGVAAAKAFHPDLVLCDIGLPGMSGYEVARALRAEAALNGVTIAALTGYGRDEDQAKARAAGFDVHLTKPVEFEALRRVFAGLGRR